MIMKYITVYQICPNYKKKFNEIILKILSRATGGSATSCYNQGHKKGSKLMQPKSSIEASFQY